jgi:hypothetical protein
MTGAHSEHQAAVAYAQAAIGEVQELLAATTAKVEESAVPAVYNATGGEACNMESGRIAFEWTLGLKERIDEIYRITDNINSELARYGGGF